MVLVGDRLRTKTKRRSPSPAPYSVQLDYIIHIQEIKPWPPSQSLRTPGAVLVQWEEHDYNRRRTCRRGLTNQVVPSLNGRIEINESFTLPLTLEQDKCVIEFNLYEPGRDKTAKCRMLGTAVLDLPDYSCGRLVKEDLSVSVPVNCKRSYKNSVQPLLFLKIQPVERTQTRSSESVSGLMREEYAEEANEAASFSTADDDNDDFSSHSLMAFAASAVHSIGKSSPQNKGVQVLASDCKHFKKKETISVNGSAGEEIIDHLILKPGEEQLATETHYRSSSCYTSTEQNTEDGPFGDFHFENQKQVKNGRLSSRSSSSTRINHLIGGDKRNDGANKVVHTRPGRLVVSSDSSRRIPHLEHRIEVLEGELIEAAAMEYSLYSVVAEHGGSMSKVHAPARRLSRLYFHSKSGRRGTAAKSVVSGLLVVAKTCGNDVPRLTFWLSNSIALRVIVNNYFGDKNGNLKKKKNKHFPRRNNSSTRTRDDNLSEDWENPPLMFVAAVERVEAWIFSRIIESLWWQTFTPRMQSHATQAISTSKYSNSSNLYPMTSLDHQQGKFSLELWKKAFRDACERICPVRAEGHDCGCLPVLSKLIMEQLITRLDVAMFNAILRESNDDIPTDPVADPISDAEVLPIPAGKASFGAGAQLKNAVGNWSRWLTDLFGIDDDDVLHANENYSETVVDDDDDNYNERRSRNQSSKCFRLLNSLSDLMMLPKDMLLSPTIRKEVCLSIGLSLVRRILNSFVLDEFCPDPIPRAVLEALYSEDSEEDFVMRFPCAAAPVVYQAPSSAFFGSNHSKTKLSESSILLKKSQTSDDELDELNSAPKTVAVDGLQSLPLMRPRTSKENGSQNTVRYNLLKKVWANSE